MKRFGGTFVLALVLMGAPARAVDRPYRVAAGVNVGGGQVDWRLNPGWMLEARAQGGTENGAEKTNSLLYGLRGYRFFHVGRPSFFGGLELAHTQAKRNSAAYRAEGMAAGAFVGAEFRLLSHLYFLMDAGPYVISMSERRTGLSDTSLDFVADLALVVGF